MKIVRADVVITSPGRNFVTLKLTTDEGLVGLGDATLNGRELAVASYLGDHVTPLLVGRDATRIEDTWQLLYKGAYWRRGPVTMTAIGAVDTALWDLAGKAAGLPVHRLLGGRSREYARGYAHVNGRTLPELLEGVGTAVAEGYTAVRVQCAVPGLEATYGVSKDGAPYEPADAALPSESTWSTPEYLRFVPRMLEAVRSAHGEAVDLLHDVHHRLSPTEAGRLGRDVEPYRLYWLEDAVPAEAQEAYRLVRQHTTTPLAVGEVLSSIWDCQQLITERLVDYIRTSVVHAGGISHVRRILSLGELYDVRSGCHGATDISPVGLAAQLHLGVVVPNFGLQEHMPHAPLVDEVFPHSYRFTDGAFDPGEAPGLGVDLDEELAAKHPYSRAYLPVNRLRDGTVHSW
jgi:mannonate dehydratase